MVVYVKATAIKQRTLVEKKLTVGSTAGCILSLIYASVLSPNWILYYNALVLS